MSFERTLSSSSPRVIFRGPTVAIVSVGAPLKLVVAAEPAAPATPATAIPKLIDKMSAIVTRMQNLLRKGSKVMALTAVGQAGAGLGQFASPYFVARSLRCSA